MLHRIFVAINLPESVRTELLSYQEKWRELPCRWASKENLHITLVFLGNTSDEELQEVSTIVRRVSTRHQPFSIEFSSISYGPSAKKPRMVWAGGVAPKELLNLQKDVEKELANSKVLHFIPEKHSWTLHLTLCRLNEEFKRLEPEERPDVNEEISLSFPVNSIEIIESKLKRGGAEYTICESISLA